MKMTDEQLERILTKIGHAEARLEALATQTRAGVPLKGARVEQVLSSYGATGTGSTNPTRNPGVFLGWSLRETAGAGATVIFRDGNDAGGPEVASCSLLAGESDRDFFGPSGLSLVTGLFLDVVAGAIAGAVYLGGIDGP